MDLSQKQQHNYKIVMEIKPLYKQAEKSFIDGDIDGYRTILEAIEKIQGGYINYGKN